MWKTRVVALTHCLKKAKRNYAEEGPWSKVTIQASTRNSSLMAKRTRARAPHTTWLLQALNNRPMQNDAMSLANTIALIQTFHFLT